MAIVRCEHCQYFDPGDGTCHQSPPIILPPIPGFSPTGSPPTPSSCFPEVHKRDWCSKGEPT